MTQVIKKDGSKEPLDAEKTNRSVQRAIEDAGDIEDDKRDLLELISRNAVKIARKKDEILSSELREIILRDIGLVDESVLHAWKAYEMKKMGIKNQ